MGVEDVLGGTGTVTGGSGSAAGVLKNSNHSLYVIDASPSVSSLRTMASSSVSEAKCPWSLMKAPRFTVVMLPVLSLSTDLKAAIVE